MSEKMTELSKKKKSEDFKLKYNKPISYTISSLNLLPCDFKEEDEIFIFNIYEKGLIPFPRDGVIENYTGWYNIVKVNDDYSCNIIVDFKGYKLYFNPTTKYDVKRRV